MESVILGAVVALLTFLAGSLGLWAQGLLKDHNAVEKARDMIGSIVGLVTLLLSLVLGTLVGNTYYFSTGQQAQIQSLMVNEVMLDKALKTYGDETKPERDKIKASLQRVYEALWLGTIDPHELTLAGSVDGLKPLAAYLASLAPKTDEQRAALADAKSRLSAFELTRIQMSMQAAAPFSKSLLGVVMIWAFVLFFGFGLISRASLTTRVALAFGSLSVGGALFIIIELAEPYTGLFRLSPAAIQQTIDAIDR